MLILVMGGSGSGKSAYAESLICNLAKQEEKYYIATMKVYDAESEFKVEKHRNARAGKGFCTIEQEKNIFMVLKQMGIGKKSALLECMSNLTANEMFGKDKMINKETVSKKIVKDVERLYGGLEHLIIVTNNVFEDGICYDEITMEYNQALGAINEQLANRASSVIEIVVGIPVVVKGEIRD